jgi:hypothetical protein
MEIPSQTEIITMDVRAGLSAEVLADLRQATDFCLARKSESIGIFGYWRAPADGARQLVVLILQSHDMGLASSASGVEAGAPAAPPVAEPYPVTITAGNAGWHRALRLLDPGDIVHMRWWNDSATLVVQPPAPNINFQFTRMPWRGSSDAQVHLEIAIWREPLSQPSSPRARIGPASPPEQ